MWNTGHPRGCGAKSRVASHEEVYARDVHPRAGRGGAPGEQGHDAVQPPRTGGSIPPEVSPASRLPGIMRDGVSGLAEGAEEGEVGDAERDEGEIEGAGVPRARDRGYARRARRRRSWRRGSPRRRRRPSRGRRWWSRRMRRQARRRRRVRPRRKTDGGAPTTSARRHAVRERGYPRGRFARGTSRRVGAREARTPRATRARGRSCARTAWTRASAVRAWRARLGAWTVLVCE